MTYSVLIMSVGQSNADCHDAGPAYDTPCLQDPRIVVPNDGFGFRGRLARPSTQPISGFDIAFGDNPATQSIGMAAAAGFLAHTKPADQPAKIIVRSAGRGGRPLISRTHRERTVDGIFRSEDGVFTITFETLLEELTCIADLCTAEGTPLRHVYLPLFHGEADQANDPDVYGGHLAEMMDLVDAHLSNLGITSDWLLTQPSGTSVGFSGNAWRTRLILGDFAANRPNAHFACANYGYGLADAAHLSAQGKALIGELLGLSMAQIRDKKLTAPVKLKRMTVDGALLDIHFESARPLLLDDTQFPEPFHHKGFHIFRQENQRIKSITQLGKRHFRLECLLPLERRSVLNYAYARGTFDVPDKKSHPFGRGCLREDWSHPSTVLPGEKLLRWVPAFSQPLSILLHHKNIRRCSDAGAPLEQVL